MSSLLQSGNFCLFLGACFPEGSERQQAGKNSREYEVELGAERPFERWTYRGTVMEGG